MHQANQAGLGQEARLTITEASKLPMFSRRRRGRPINVSTIWRWAKRGVRGIRLETELQGGMRLTSEEALIRFFTALQAIRDGAPVVPRGRTPKQRQQASERAGAELDRRWSEPRVQGIRGST